MDELCEMVTWAQLGLHKKPVGLLNTAGYYDKFIEFVDHASGEGFVKQKLRGLLLEAKTPEQLLALFDAHRPVDARRWLRHP